MTFTKLIVSISSRCKPVLIKILPIKILRKIKRSIIEISSTKFLKINHLPFIPQLHKNGVNLIGDIKCEIGLGQSCRLLADALQATMIPFTIYYYQQISAMQDSDTSWDKKISNTTPFNINLVHINPYELFIAYKIIDNKIWNNRYNIAFWLWELEEFPQEWCVCFNLFDEIWTPSEFVSNSIRKKTSLPVFTVPYALSAPVDEMFNRDYFHLPKNSFLVLIMYDCNSNTDRKNPMDSIRAYKKAFSPQDSLVGLIVKLNNPQEQDIHLIKETLSGYKNINLITNILPKVEVNSLIQCADVFISLHRSEGFGLVLAESMMLGTPAIATNWSANTEFMNNSNSCLVGFEFTTICKTTGHFRKGNRWAAPNIDQAADYILKLYNDKEFYSRISENAQLSIKNQFSKSEISRCMAERITEIYEKYQ